MFIIVGAVRSVSSMLAESAAWFEQLVRLLSTANAVAGDSIFHPPLLRLIIIVVVVLARVSGGGAALLHCSDGWDRTPQARATCRLRCLHVFDIAL